MKRRNWIVAALFVAGWIVFLGQPTAVATKLRMIFAQLSTPFVRLGDYIPTVKSRRDLDRQVRQLRQDNDILRLQLTKLSEEGRRNLELTELLNLKRRLPGKTVGARIIGRDASNWYKSIQLDRGSHDGITINRPVVTADGVVGKIILINRGDSRSLLLSDPSCRISALLQHSREPGIVAGANSPFGREPHLVMTHVNREAKITIGEPVITSGLGGVFPKGIPIGTVIQSRINAQTGMYLDVEIKPAVTFRQLEEVLVLLE